MIPKVSIIASSVRYQLYQDLCDSLEGTTVDYEIVFAGNKPPVSVYPNLRYITTGDIKPAQCYEIARREAKGETILWAADDCEFPNDVIGRAYNYWKKQEDEKLILSIQTKESGYNLPDGALFDMEVHRLLPNDPSSPLMAPLALMSRQFLDDLGGFVRKYICGQYENLVVMMARERGGSVEVFGGADCYIDLDHLGKSIRIGECKDQAGFLERPFATGYRNDREALLHTCCNFAYQYPPNCGDIFFLAESTLRAHQILPKLLDDFEPYEDKDILTVSQGPKGKWD